MVGTRRTHLARDQVDNQPGISDQDMQEDDGSRQEEVQQPRAGGGGAGGQQTLTRFFGGGNKDDSESLVQSTSKGPKQHQKLIFRAKRHPMSLMKEGVSTVRYLPDFTQSIFTIIMPWRQEQEDEEKKRHNKMKQTQTRDKQQSLINWVVKKPIAEPSARAITKEEEKYQQQAWDGELDENSDDFHKLQKVVKVKEVQKVRLHDYTSNVQAILINPKWSECDHFTKMVKLNSQTSSQGAEKTTT